MAGGPKAPGCRWCSRGAFETRAAPAGGRVSARRAAHPRWEPRRGRRPERRGQRDIVAVCPWALTCLPERRQTRHMLSIVATLCVLTAQAPGVAPALTPRDSAFHALNRLAYGARPGEADSVAKVGVMRWIEQQLDADHIPDSRLAAREREFKILDYDRADLAGRYRDAVQERQRLQREAAATGDSSRMRGARPMQEFRELGGELQQLAIVRAAISERQLHEVMVDFWTNHFNVFVGKGADRFLLPSYIEETIRPRALARFEDLLIATAESPAMLFYLDNAQSVAPGSSPPFPLSARRRAAPGDSSRRRVATDPRRHARSPARDLHIARLLGCACRTIESQNAIRICHQRSPRDLG